jgi:hypothetical protein
MKLKMIALAVALVASAGANATISNTPGEVIATISDGANQAVSVDLGVTVSQLLAAAGKSGISLDWNLYNSTFADLSGNGTTWTAQTYGNTVQTDAAVTAAGARLSVFGGSGLLKTNNLNFLTTADSNGVSATLSNSNLGSFGNLYNFLISNPSANSAYAFNASTDAVSNNYNGYANFGNASNAPNQDATIGITGISFYDIVSSSKSGPAFATTTLLSPVWNFNATTGDLTLASVAAVPEANTLAMLLSGLGMVGAIVRRRHQKQA